LQQRSEPLRRRDIDVANGYAERPRGTVHKVALGRASRGGRRPCQNRNNRQAGHDLAQQLVASRNEAFTRAFRQGLSDLGYVEARTIVIEERYADGDPSRIPELIEDLLSRNVDVFLTGGANVAQIALW
jgi:hypothetical protein